MDAGIEALNQIHTVLAIDEGWTLRGERGFTWWAHRLQQSVTVGRAIRSGNTDVFHVESLVPLLRNVRTKKCEAERVVNGINRLATSTAYIYEPATRDVFGLQRGVVHADTLSWRPVLLAAFFMQQLRDAEARLDVLAMRLDGEPAISAHPTAGPRRDPDEMLSVIGRYFSPHQDESPGFRNRFEFDAVVDMTDSLNAYSFGATEDGLALEVPFGHATALILMKADGPHPHAGRGLGVYQLLPERYDECEAARLANWLNLRERTAPFAGEFIGAWCKAPSADQFLVAHARFIPTALCRPGLILDAAIGAIGHLSEVNRLLHGGAATPDVLELIGKRLGRAVFRRGTLNSPVVRC